MTKQYKEDGSDYKLITDETDLKKYALEHFENTPDHRTIICPFCGSGSGANHSSAFSLNNDGGSYGKVFKCHSCGKAGNIFTLAGKYLETDNKTEQLHHLAEWAGIRLEGETKPTPLKAAAPIKAAPMKTQSADKEQADKEQLQKQAAEKLKQYQAEIENPAVKAYLNTRGILLDQAKEWGFGYDKNANLAKDANGNYCKKGGLVIKYPNENYFITRSLDTTAKKNKYIKPKGLTEPLFITEPITNTHKYFYIVEGQLDALIISKYAPAIALGTARGTDKILKAAKAADFSGVFIVALDNDETGAAATAETVKSLQLAGYSAFTFTGLQEKQCGYKVKDFNDLYLCDALAFFEQIEKACNYAVNRREVLQALTNETIEHEAKQEHEEKLRQEKEALNQKRYNGADMLETLNTYIERTAAENELLTGFRHLDEELGGLRKGLYVLGAMSSLGKTDFTLQVAENLAAAGHDVLFFALEMGAAEVTARIIARNAFLSYLQDGGDIEQANVYTPTPLQAYDGKEQLKAGLNVSKSIAQGVERFKNGALNHFHFVTSISETTAEDIRAQINYFVHETGRAPIVFVDYLQIMPPDDPHLNERQTVDQNIKALKRMSEEFEIPIFCVCSINRDSYKKPISFEAFKESGAIEYTADVVLGLQFFGQGQAKKKDEGIATNTGSWIDSQKRKTPRLVRLKILKARLNPTGKGFNFYYYPQHSYFEARAPRFKELENWSIEDEETERKFDY